MLTLKADHNLLSNIPDLSSSSSTLVVNFSYNQLSFEDLLANTSLPGAVQDGSYVEIYNSSGTKIYEQEANVTSVVDISLENQPSGLYYLRLVSGSDISSQPFIVK